MTRRNFAGAQASTLAITGSLLGITVGLVPGIAITWNTTRPGGPASTLDPTVIVPWLRLAIPLIAIPVLAAALAWVSILKAPLVTRRLT